jgi:hypothetical protein
MIILVAKIQKSVIATVADKAEVVKEAKTLMTRGMDNLPWVSTIISLMKIWGPITPTTVAQCSFLRSQKESFLPRYAEVIASIPRPAVTSKCATAKKQRSVTNSQTEEI